MKKSALLINALAEFLPVVVFLVASELFGFITGLYALTLVTAGILIFEWFFAERIPRFGLVAALTILLFGIVSIVTQDPFFIMIKDTLYALSFGCALLIGMMLKRSYLEVLFGDYFGITDRGWRILTYRWMVFFFLLAFCNEAARIYFSPEVWLYYKFGALLITWVFGFYQFTLAKRERLPESSVWGLRIRGS